MFDSIFSTLSDNASLLVGIAIIIAAILGAINLRNSGDSKGKGAAKTAASIDRQEWLNHLGSRLLQGLVFNGGLWGLTKFFWWFTIEGFWDQAMLDLRIRTGDTWFGHQVVYPDKVFIAGMIFSLYLGINYRGRVPAGHGVELLLLACVVCYTLYQWFLWASAWTTLW